MADPYMAEIRMFGFIYAPRDWTYCAGQLLQISQFSAIFALVGTYYGGDGRVTFGVPDLRGRRPLGSSTTGGQGPGLPVYPLGHKSGRWEQTLIAPNLPSHYHTVSQLTTAVSVDPDVTLNASIDKGTSPTPVNGSYLADVEKGGGAQDLPELIYRPNAGTDTVELGGINVNAGTSTAVIPPHNTQNTGGNVAFDIQNPYTAINFCFALDGIFPPRN